MDSTLELVEHRTLNDRHKGSYSGDYIVWTTNHHDNYPSNAPNSSALACKQLCMQYSICRINSQDMTELGVKKLQCTEIIPDILRYTDIIYYSSCIEVDT